MDLSKSYDFFQPDKDDARIHIVGCGSVGSTIAENLARCGVTKMTLWDFDTVEPRNICNQMFRQQDVGRLKVEALKDILMDINPDVADELELKPDGWKGKLMSGYVFLCVDNIELRREIVEKHMDSPYVKAMFDVRTMLTGAQHYAADWSNYKMKQDLLKSMQFSHEEAAEETPVSACGVVLGIVTTVRLICGMCVNNFIRFVKEEGLWKFVQIDGFTGILDCF
ncbi:MAG: ThiF family adenylyltransferase [Prevotella sp.]|nr:ThiF family adenylyltransferase [Prevotella sp.]